MTSRTVKPINFRPNQADLATISASPLSPTQTLRQALRLLDHQRWLDTFYAAAVSDPNFDPNAEPEAW